MNIKKIYSHLAFHDVFQSESMNENNRYYHSQLSWGWSVSSLYYCPQNLQWFLSLLSFFPYLLDSFQVTCPYDEPTTELFIEADKGLDIYIILVASSAMPAHRVLKKYFCHELFSFNFIQFSWVFTAQLNLWSSARTPNWLMFIFKLKRHILCKRYRTNFS